MPSASVMAKPKIKLANCPAAADGFRIAAAKQLPKMMPTPTPAPPMPMQAIPAPMYFAAVGSMRKLLFEGCLKERYSMSRMNRIVEVDASQNGEDVGLQQSHQQLERSERRRQSKRQRGAEPA